jgi:hypothetical protein
MVKTLKLSWAFLTSPSSAAEASRDERNASAALKIYAAFTFLYLLFFWLKPFDFPDQNAVLPPESQGLAFWLRVMLWQPPLEAAWIVFLIGMMRWFREGSLPVKLAAAAAWTASPFVLMALHAAGSLPKTALAAGAIAWMGLYYPLLRGSRRQEWLPCASFMLGLNAIGVVLLIPMTLMVLMKASSAFMTTQAIGGLWMLAAATLGLRELSGQRLPRAFMAVLLSMFFQIAFALTLHLLGIIPKDILKALLYV